ncbi:hypothetical protein CEXT_308731 [Caerostris extrusa]|uniref:Uncharacterized protein n=1 Tax=Caerostris extrusa TaxID=172846 RepID=A0AAV4YD70_CAEEX|nr:hypothetical protein CEXT_308731 [Caerostris extrusa]
MRGAIRFQLRCINLLGPNDFGMHVRRRFASRTASRKPLVKASRNTPINTKIADGMNSAAAFSIVSNSAKAKIIKFCLSDALIQPLPFDASGNYRNAF